MISPQTTDQRELQRFGKEISQQAERIRPLAAGADDPGSLPKGFVGPEATPKVSAEDMDRLKEQGTIPEGMPNDKALLVAETALRTEINMVSDPEDKRVRTEPKYFVPGGKKIHLGGLSEPDFRQAGEHRDTHGEKPQWSPNN